MFSHLILLLIRNTSRRACALGLSGIVFCLLAASLIWGQSAGPVPASAQKVPASLPHLYWHFLLYQNHLDQAAAQREANGKDGAWLRDHFQKKLGFTDAQFAVIRSTARRLDGELKAVDAQAMAIINADHAANPLSPGTLPMWRAVPPELKALSQQHEALILSEVAGLKGTLGTDLAARLDTFLQTEVARNVTVQKFHHPSTPEEARQSLLQALQKKEVHQ